MPLIQIRLYVKGNHVVMSEKNNKNLPLFIHVKKYEWN